jgi:hypothetical protein
MFLITGSAFVAGVIVDCVDVGIGSCGTPAGIWTSAVCELPSQSTRAGTAEIGAGITNATFNDIWPSILTTAVAALTSFGRASMGCCPAGYGCDTAVLFDFVPIAAEFAALSDWIRAAGSSGEPTVLAEPGAFDTGRAGSTCATATVFVPTTAELGAELIDRISAFASTAGSICAVIGAVAESGEFDCV